MRIDTLPSAPARPWQLVFTGMFTPFWTCVQSPPYHRAVCSMSRAGVTRTGYGGGPRVASQQLDADHRCSFPERCTC
jgi:hypothetical protein